MRGLSLAALVLSLFVTARHVPLGPLLSELDHRLTSLGPAAPWLFGAAYVVLTLACVPGVALTLLGAAAFGYFTGVATVLFAATISAAIAFLLARTVARARVATLARRHPRFGAFDAAIGAEGWKVVLCLRLSPVVPFSIGNYLYGLTAVRFWPYVAATWLGMLPGTCMNVYLAHVGRLSLSARSESSARTPLEWLFLTLGLAATVGVTVLVARRAKQILSPLLDAAAPTSDLH